ncbi:hypothetical protein I6A81_21365 [Frankia sp. CN7]|nr:hypothetical protein [Frankia nepalensis]
MPGATVFGIEILVPDPKAENAQAFAVFHLGADSSDLLGILRAVAGRRASTTQSPNLAALLPTWVTLTAGARPFTIAFLTRLEPDLPPPPNSEPVPGWSTTDLWLWQLATRTSHTDFPPDPDHAADLHLGKVVLSADWRGFVARDGAAFLGQRPDQGDDDPYLGYAQYYTHAAYTDALLIGMIQNTAIAALIDETALAFNARDLPRHLARLETRLARFRAIYWLRDASHHGPANNILTAYQAQHHLPEKFDAILNEIADLNRIAQTQEGTRTSAALGLLTVVGLPFGAALGVLQVLGADTIRDLLLALAGAVAGTAVLLITRLGRVLLRSLRRLE